MGSEKTSLSFIIGTTELYALLENGFPTLRSEPEFYSGIIEHLTEYLLRDDGQGMTMTDIVNYIEDVGVNREHAYQILKSAVELFILLITQHFPDFGSPAYRNLVSYEPYGQRAIQFHLDKRIFGEKWDNITIDRLLRYPGSH